jgi:hypothetical protein
MKITDPAEYKKKFGDPLKKMLLDRYKKLDFAAEILRTSPSMLSHYFSGRRIPGKNFEELLRKNGFDLTIFDYITNQEELVNLPADTRGLTWNQVVWLVEQLRNIIADKNTQIGMLHNTIRFYEKRVTELQKKVGV